MNQRTDSSFEFSGWDRVVLLGLTVLTLGLVFLSSVPSEHAEFDRGFQFTLYPWFTATAVTNAGGLDVFSGLPLTPPSDAQRASMLLGLLLGLVVGPTLLLLAWRSSKIQRDGKLGAKTAFLIGGMLTYALALPAIPSAILQWSNYASMQSAQRGGEDRDEVVYSIQLILCDAKQYKIIPSSEGGGGGSFSGYVLPDALSGNRFGNFEVQTENDSVLVVKGVPILNPSAATIAALSVDGALQWKYQGY